MHGLQRRKIICQVAAVALAIATLAGCATVNPIAPVVARQKTSAVLGIGATSVWVPSRGELIEAALKIIPHSTEMGARLAETLSHAKQSEVRVGISGPSSTLTRLAALEGLARTQGQLPKLQFLFIGAKRDEAAVREAVEKKGGRFLFAESDD